jgi:proline dehydrogenase
MGFKGVILGYAKEVIVDPAATREEVAGSGSTKSTEGSIDQWREGNLRSLPMIGNGDFLAVK